MRDNFTETVRRALALRVAHRCSKPDCRVPTSGPHSDPSRAISIGVAAHITAASPGGPRYDERLSPDDRRAPQNGIWLCHTHGTLVDTDEVTFSVPTLLEWKRTAEASAFSELGQKPYSPGTGALEHILVRDGDLPAGFTAAQVRSIPPQMFHGLPPWTSVVYRELAGSRDHSGGGIALFRFASHDALATAFTAIMAGFGADSQAPHLRTASTELPGFGDRAAMTVGHFLVPPFDVTFGDLVVALSPLLLHVRMLGAEPIAIFTYAQRLLNRLKELGEARGA